jgi:hypothetical protein
MERAVAEIRALFAGEIAERRKMPRDDLISYLVEARIDGRKLDDEHIIGTFRMLLFAGIHTSMIAVACGISPFIQTTASGWLPNRR